MTTPADSPKKVNNLGSLSKKLAGQIVFICEREINVDVAYQKIAEELKTQLVDPDKLPYFQSVLQTLLDKEETEEYAGKAVNALFGLPGEDAQTWNKITNHFIHGHQVGDMPSFRHPDSKKVFSAYAFTLGESFIQMMRLGSENYDRITQIYTHCIREENELERQRQQKQSSPSSRGSAQTSAPANPKKLYDDIADYISERAVHRARTLNPENPNEFIQILSDRLRSTRRYIIQDLINKNSIEKKRNLEKAFKEKQASAEEIVFASKPFQKGLKLFKDAKFYNSRYIEAEKKRVTLQLVPMILAVSAVGLALMDVFEFDYQSMILIALFAVGARILFRPQFFQRFYPKDITSTLEEEVSLVAAVFQKCSKEQLSAFLRKQLKEVNDPYQINLMMDFVTYIYSIIPKSRERLMTRAEFKETIDSMSWHVSKARRGLAS